MHMGQRDDLLKQADRADNIADQAVDDEMKKTLREASMEYRDKAKQDENRRPQEEGINTSEASAMTEASGLTAAQSGRPSGSASEYPRHAIPRVAYKLREVALAASLHSILAAFLIGVLVGRRR